MSGDSNRSALTVKGWIEQQRGSAITSYPMLWNRMIAEWKSTDPGDRVWLMYSANYLFRTHGCRWALDPLRLINRLPGAPEMDVSRDLKPLELVILTHRHYDHLDLGLIHLLSGLPIHWVIPKDLLPLIQRQVKLPASRILVPIPWQPFDFHGLHITPFDGLHWEDDPSYRTRPRGVPSTGYLVECGGNRWLFPGDTRTYDPSPLTRIGGMDTLFAHVWLGRAAALFPEPPLLEPFYQFCVNLNPRRIILTHLEEWSRDITSMWSLEHASQLMSVFKEKAPNLKVEIARMGDSLDLS